MVGGNVKWGGYQTCAVPVRAHAQAKAVPEHGRHKWGHVGKVGIGGVGSVAGLVGANTSIRGDELRSIVHFRKRRGFGGGQLALLRFLPQRRDELCRLLPILPLLILHMR